MTSTPLCHLTETLQSLHGDKETLHLLIREFLRTYPEQVLHMAQAYQTDDLSALANCLHSARSTVSIFCAVAVRDQIIALEHGLRMQSALARPAFYRFLNDYMRIGLELAEYQG
ncbi:Hpt domain-containing protein [Leeia oryzae]|uniref:Hpt domain-containing protein n=1 Tax=Leeia oryzae TaxID=356662 RepID=UPI000369F35F|nr:Hpt domain-containing protein [Leeia oryzae]